MPHPQRIIAIDVFRGITMACMVLVNNPGDYLYVFAPLKHAKWFGWTPTDLIYPCFLFIVGVSLQYSLQARRQAGESDSRIFWIIVKRAVILFLLGIVDNSYPFPSLHTLRIPGVLQRIAVVCVFATLVSLKLRDTLVPVLAAALLLGYWALLTMAPVPMSGLPDLQIPTANLGSWLDYRLLGTHLWLEEQWDPEGILSTFPAFCITLFGVLAAKRLQARPDPFGNAAVFAIYAVVAVAAGLVWDLWFPIIRWLWTSSFILLASGAAFALLSVSLVVSSRRWAEPLLLPARAFGANAIVIYLTSSIFEKTLYIVRPNGTDSIHEVLYAALCRSWLPPKEASLAWAVGYTLLMLALAWSLYAKRIFIRV